MDFLELNAMLKSFNSVWLSFSYTYLLGFPISQALEKIRIRYDKEYEKDKCLFNRGAEAHELEVAQTHIRKLSSKICVGIRVVNSISNRINKLRDEELWPQTYGLIHGYALCLSVSIS